ncbi:MAG TPA: serine hydrolase [Streptosporangiaceae bacterium]|nr:serine hydrolase [Streptosporangiaceae bacterium]HJY65771.1 serine hydrolase [Streptosporangiaceae bacterium]
MRAGRGTWPAGSVTKTFTATPVLQLVDQKRTGLDDPRGPLPARRHTGRRQDHHP